MSVVIRAHFDGKAIIPDEPVDLPLNQPLEFELKQEPAHLPWDSNRAEEAWTHLKSRPIPGLHISDEAIRRDNLYENRL
ncbi:MAG: hypothetical protein ACYC64_11900 [Armatimonadota bacterium]